MNSEMSHPRPTSAEPEPEPEAEFHSESNGTSRQSLQHRESRNGKEITPGWITEAEWTIYIKENSIDDPRSLTVVSIFRVPYLLKKSKKEFYVPQTVSLGPYHHRSPELHLMNNHKGRAMHLMRTRFNNNNSDLANVDPNNKRDLANVDPNNMDFAHRVREEIVKLEIDIRDSYKEKIDCDGKTLALMLSLDGCFILQLLRSLSVNFLEILRSLCSREALFERKYILYSGRDILEDIVKLENQIPMIVLQKLLQLEPNSIDRQDFLLVRLRQLLRCFYKVEHEDVERRWLWPQGVVHHILGLMHSFIVSSLSDHDDPVAESDLSAWRKWFKCSCVSRYLGKCISLWSKYMKCGNEWCSAIKWYRKDSAVNDVIRIRGAVELKNAGIKFKVCGAAGGTRMIKFDPKNATIFLPKIRIVDSTEVLFRNLIAFEMCKPYGMNDLTSEINNVTSYVFLMDELIDTGEDVALLIRSGIVTNFLGSDAEVAELFNGLCKDVTLGIDSFEKLRQDVHDHYGNVRKVQLAELVKDHFSSPWKIVALAGAILIVLFTTVQTIFSVLSYYK